MMACALYLYIDIRNWNLQIWTGEIRQVLLNCLLMVCQWWRQRSAVAASSLLTGHILHEGRHHSSCWPITVCNFIVVYFWLHNHCLNREKLAGGGLDFSAVW